MCQFVAKLLLCQLIQMVTDLVKLKVGGDPVHEADETPEGVNLVLHYKEKRGKEV